MKAVSWVGTPETTIVKIELNENTHVLREFSNASYDGMNLVSIPSITLDQYEALEPISIADDEGFVIQIIEANRDAFDNLYSNK